MNNEQKNIKYTKKILEEAVKNNINVAGVVRSLGLIVSSNWHYYISNRIKYFNINTSHFLGKGSNKYKTSNYKKKPEDILILRNNDRRQKHYVLKRALIEIGIEYKCNICGIKEWLDQKLHLDIHHKNGNWLDDRKENLQFLCPNCHSLTDNFRSKNIKLR